MPDRIDRECDPMRGALALDRFLAALAVEGEGHREQRLHGVALRAARRAYLGLAAGCARIIVEDARDRLGRDPRPVVRDGDPGIRNR